MRGKIAIVGANGFVGRRLLALLVDRGRSVLGIVRSDEDARAVRESGGVPFTAPDLLSSTLESLGPALSNCEALVYTAPVRATKVVEDPTEPSGLLNVLKECRNAGVPKVVFMSGLGVARYGMNPHCTNPYFLAKMAGETALFRSGLSAIAFRPSYIFGSGDRFLSPLAGRIDADPAVEIPGSGEYRLQPISVADAARAIASAVDQKPETSSRVIDLVGPEVLSYRALILRIASYLGRKVNIKERPIEEAVAQARVSGYFGLRPHDLSCLLCDEVSEPSVVRALIGGELETLDAILAETLGRPPASSGSTA